MANQGLRPAVRALRNLRNWAFQWESRCVVLLYHRIVAEHPSKTRLGVSRDLFEAQMDWLKKKYAILSYPELTQGLLENDIPKRSVVISFDDGYSDNFHFARPILEKFKIPAIFFITTSLIGNEAGFWWDEIEELIQGNPGNKPDISLSVGAQHFHRKIESAEEQSAAVRDLTALLKSCTKEEMDGARISVREWAGISGNVSSDKRPMNLEELQTLFKNPLFTAGAHSETHISLASQSTEIQKKEILGSKQALENWLNCPIRYFAYPFGLPDEHFNRATEKIVERAGLESACSTARSFITPFRPDIYRIPRFSVYDWPVEQFKTELQQFFQG